MSVQEELQQSYFRNLAEEQPINWNNKNIKSFSQTSPPICMYLRRCYRYVQVLVLLDCGVTCVITYQILQWREPLPTLTWSIVLAIFATDFVVEQSELFVQEGEHKTTRVTLTHAHKVCTRLGNRLQSHASIIPGNTTMIPPEETHQWKY